MGSYTEVSVARYPLISSKSAVIPEIMTVFRETDKKVYERRLGDRNPLVWGEFISPDADRLEIAIEYSCETWKVIDRLNAMGFSLSRAEIEFELGRNAELETYKSYAEDRPTACLFADHVAFLQSLTLEAYMIALRTVMDMGLRGYPFDDHKRTGLSPVVEYILKDSGFSLGFPGDLHSLLRIACEVSAPDSSVVQDITELVHGGYYAEDDPVCENETRALVAGHPEYSHRIILTEGSSDRWILKQSLALLYPHMEGYYSFLDFETSRSQGGSGHLVLLIKSLAAAGITNRIIALFDNDTAAKEAKRSLSHVQLPGNIVVQSYPDLAQLQNYPTLGPTGTVNFNVNGLAASIELYLGDDVLRKTCGDLTPIQWKGYNETLDQYQGEVMHKTQLQEKFKSKVQNALADSSLVAKQDWSGLSAILQQVFSAFD